MAVSSERESELAHQRVEVTNKAVVTTGVNDLESSHNRVYCEYLIFICISQILFCRDQVNTNTAKSSSFSSVLLLRASLKEVL